jgi:hypothetical protein
LIREKAIGTSSPDQSDRLINDFNASYIRALLPHVRWLSTPISDHTQGIARSNTLMETHRNHCGQLFSRGRDDLFEARCARRRSVAGTVIALPGEQLATWLSGMLWKQGIPNIVRRVNIKASLGGCPPQMFIRQDAGVYFSGSMRGFHEGSRR